MSSAGASEQANDRHAVWGADRCQEAALFATTEAARVAPLVDVRYRSRLLTAGPPGAELATLLVTLNRCTNTHVISDRGTFAADSAVEVIVGAMMSGSSESTDLFQFYTLRSYVDWPPLAAAFQQLGAPVIHVPRIEFRLALRPFPGIAAIDVSVPAPGDPFTTSGTVLAANPLGLDARATQFAVGPHGAIRFDHHSPVIAVNPAASATLRAARADGFLAGVFGSDRRDAHGLYFEKGVGHQHSAALIG